MPIISAGQKRRKEALEATLYNRNASGGVNISNQSSPEGIFNQFRPLGKGSYGNVYQASVYGTNKRVAIKIMDFDEDKETIQNEVKTMKKMNHPNIVTLFNTFMHGNQFWIIMELCQTNTTSFFKKIKVLISSPRYRSDIERLVYYVVHEICAALHYLHSMKIIHRDIKGQNVLLTVSGDVKLCDMGIAKQSRSSENKYKTMIGTPLWMAPEVLALNENKNREGYSFPADVFSTGCSAYEIIFYKPPRANLNVKYILSSGYKPKNAIQVSLKDPEILIPLNADAIKLINEMLAQDPNKRPTAEECRVRCAMWFDYDHSKSFCSSLILDDGLGILPKVNQKANVGTDMENMSRKAENQPNLRGAQMLENRINAKESQVKESQQIRALGANGFNSKQQMNRYTIGNIAEEDEQVTDKTMRRISLVTELPPLQHMEKNKTEKYRIMDGEYINAIDSADFDKEIYYSNERRLFCHNFEQSETLQILLEDYKIKDVRCMASKLVIFSTFRNTDDKNEPKKWKILLYDVVTQHYPEVLVRSADAVIVTEQLDSKYLIASFHSDYRSKSDMGILKIYSEEGQKFANYLTLPADGFMDESVDFKLALLVKHGPKIRLYYVVDTMVKFLESDGGWVSEDRTFFPTKMHDPSMLLGERSEIVMLHYFGVHRTPGDDETLIPRIAITNRRSTHILMPNGCQLTKIDFFDPQNAPLSFSRYSPTYIQKSKVNSLFVRNLYTGRVIWETTFSPVVQSKIKVVRELRDCWILSISYKSSKHDKKFSKMAILLRNKKYD